MAAAPEFRRADPEEVALFQSVRDELHPELGGYELGLVFRDQPAKSSGREAQAVAHLASTRDATAFLLGLDGWIEVFDDAWAEGEEGRRYLLDHELHHFCVRRGKLALRGHDFEDWPEVLARHDPAVTGLQRLLRETPVVADGCRNAE